MNRFSKSQKRAALAGVALVALCVVDLAQSCTSRPMRRDATRRRSRSPSTPPPSATPTCRSILQGLGTVQAFYTVTVTARVDGELQKIAFTEGQTVHKGDLLAQIDPRPNQAALRTGGRHQGQGRGATGQREARFRSLHPAAAAGPGEQANRRYGSAPWSIN